jgi:hypothetical protein
VVGDEPAGLTATAQLYLDFQAGKGRPPGSFGELAGHGLDQSRPLPPAAARLEVVWGAGLGPLADPPADAAVAWTPAGSDGRRHVLAADGTVKELTADEFSRVGKAKPRAANRGDGR